MPTRKLSSPPTSRLFACTKRRWATIARRSSRRWRTEYTRRRTQIRELYEAEIDELRIEERRRRYDAIADFERFLARYPNHPDYTPDVIFRLAELHYEKSTDDYNLADQEFQAYVQRYELGLIPELPPEPEKDFTTSITLFQQLIRDFPEYRQLDGAYYLMAICYLQMFEDDLAYDGFMTLVRDFPESDFAQEAWLRIGEYHFEVAAFEDARSAYMRALSYGDSRWYDKILFKLGWSHYLLSDYDPAIGSFIDLLDYYADSDGGESALKEEALQYYAISIAEEDWDLDGERDPDFVMGRVRQYLQNGKEYEIEVLDRLAELLMENQRFGYAAEVFQAILDQHPFDRLNPQRHEQIVVALNRQRMLDEAFEEQRRLGTLYGPGSEWYAEQERQGNIEAMAYAERLARENLLDSANYYYVQANTLATQAAASGDPNLEQQAIEQFRFASRIYNEFLEAYPNDSESYATRMYYAQALYFSQPGSATRPRSSGRCETRSSATSSAKRRRR